MRGSLIAAGTTLIPVGGHLFAASFQWDGVARGAFGFFFRTAGVLGFAAFGADFVAVRRGATRGVGGAALAAGFGAGFRLSVGGEAELKEEGDGYETEEFHAGITDCP